MDPLAQLKDIHLPAQVHNYPIAPGWWILLALAIIALVLLIRFYLRYRKVRQMKKQVIAKIQHATNIEESLVLLKIAMMNYFPRNETAALHTKVLHTFMVNQLPPSQSARFNDLVGDSLTLCYQANANINVEQFNQAISYWLNHALPPKAQKKLANGGHYD